MTRVSILSNEKHKAIRFCFEKNQLVIAANNQEQEQAEEVIDISFDSSPIEICFNYGYLMDVLSKVSASKIRFQLKQANTPVLITPVSIDTLPDVSKIAYIIMPMCL